MNSDPVRDLDLIRETTEPGAHLAGPNRWARPHENAGEPRTARTSKYVEDPAKAGGSSASLWRRKSVAVRYRHRRRRQASCGRQAPRPVFARCAYRDRERRRFKTDSKSSPIPRPDTSPSISIHRRSGHVPAKKSDSSLHCLSIRTQQDRERAAKALALSDRQVRRKLRRYEAFRSVEAFLPFRRGPLPGSTQMDPEIERLMDEQIRTGI